MIQTLFAGRAGDFLRDAAFGAAPCIFVHVPKTAGTSLRAELAAILPPDVNIHVDYTDTSRSFHDRIDDAVARFLDQAGPRGIRFAMKSISACWAVFGTISTRVISSIPNTVRHIVDLSLANSMSTVEPPISVRSIALDTVI